MFAKCYGDHVGVWDVSEDEALSMTLGFSVLGKFLETSWRVLGEFLERFGLRK